MRWRKTRWRKIRTKRDVLLKLAALVSELADLREQNADFARKSFAEVIEVPAVYRVSSVRLLLSAHDERTLGQRQGNSLSVTSRSEGRTASLESVKDVTEQHERSVQISRLARARGRQQDEMEVPDKLRLASI